MRLLRTFIAALAVASVVGDLYLHHPAGSNDRNRERNDNRNNGNRLFDSQNNDKGGYPFRGDPKTVDGDQLKLYAGSILPIEYTLQHSCGPNSNAWCNVVVQYMCTDTNPTLRDGYPQGEIVDSDPNNAGYKKRDFISAQQNDDGTQRIPCPGGIGCNGDNFNSATLNSGTATELLAKFYAGDGKVTADGNDYYGAEFGYHETFDWYKTHCLYTSRNMGLYTADQKLGGSRRRFTRQNPNGNRQGLECPEERDYYPWWGVSQWKDVVVIVSNTSWCEFFQAESQNVKSRFYCQITDTARQAAPNQVAPIDPDNCKVAGGTWTEVAAWNVANPDIKAPDCILHPISRDNHLGNANLVNEKTGMFDSGSPRPETAAYLWTVPADAVGKKCVLRLRYNMSSDNYPAVNSFQTVVEGTKIPDFIDWSFNCPRVTQNNGGDVDDNQQVVEQNDQCSGLLTENTRPLYNRPYVQVFTGSETIPKLGLAINTNQVSRTFQDRSYVFAGQEVPSGSKCNKIYNLGTRGRRGNIVQCYPSVEYDFVPTYLDITDDDCVHIQFMGSDFNAEKNPNNGEGWKFSDRFNMVQVNSVHTDIPNPITTATMWGTGEEAAKKAEMFAFGGITDFTQCEEFYNGKTGEQNSIKNCGKLNPAPNHFDAGLQKFSVGKFEYVSTRNNNFSNRSQKGTIVVTKGKLSTTEAALVGVGAVVGTGAILAGGLFLYAKARPGSSVAKKFGVSSS